MYEGIEIPNVNLANLPKDANGSLVLDMKDAQTLNLGANVKFDPESLTVLENGEDAELKLTDAEGNVITIVLQNLNDALLQNATKADAAPLFEVFQVDPAGIKSALLSFTDINDLDAAAAGGNTADASRFNLLLDQVNQFIASNNLAREDGNPAANGPDAATDPNFARDITFSGDLEAVITEDIGQSEEGIITGTIVNTDPNYPSLLYIAQTTLTEYGLFVLNEDGTWFYNLDESNPDIQGLSDIQSILESFNVQVQGQYAAFDLEITVNGLNDKPYVEDINLNDASSSWLIGASRTYQDTGDGSEGPGGSDGSEFYDINGASEEEINALFGVDETSVVVADLFSGDSDTSPTDGAAMKFNMNVADGETVTFTWTFTDREGDGSGFNDFSFVVIDGEIIQLLAQVSDEGSINTGTFTYTFPTGGNHSITFGAMNDDDSIVDSNLEITYVSGGTILSTESVGHTESDESVLYETSSFPDAEGVNDTENEVNNIYNGEIKIVDADYDNTHMLVVENVQLTDPSGSGVNVEDDIQATLDLNPDTGNWEYNIEGDFSHLAVGEKATLTIEYHADDQRGFEGDPLNDDTSHEDSISDTKTITLTITGTNDKPVLDEVGADEGNVVVFFNSTYSGTAEGSGYEGGDGSEYGYSEEAYTIKETLLSQGHDVELLSNEDATSFANALDSTNVLVMPENEKSPYSGLSTESKDAIVNFVTNGGSLVINADGSNKDTSFLNELFGFSLVDGGSGSTYTKTADAIGSIYEGSPETLPYENGTYLVQTASLPENAVSYYETDNGSALFTIPFGDGEITFLAYDWFNAAPIGTQDGGWLDILDLTIGNAKGESFTAVETTQDGNIDDITTSYSGTISGSDNDTNDTHTISLVDTTLESGQEAIDIFMVSNDSSFSPFPPSPFPPFGGPDGQEAGLPNFPEIGTFVGAVVLDTEDSTTLTVSDIEPLEIVFTETLDENGQFSYDYDFSGNFNALALGEKATVTFSYTVKDNQGIDATNGINEASESEVQTITLTIIGTNDRPEITSTELPVDGIIMETLDDDAYANGVDDTQADEFTSFTGAIVGTDDDDTDTHTIDFVTQPQLVIAQDTNAPDQIEASDLPYTVTFAPVVTVDGDFTTSYTLNGNFNALANGETATITFEYAVTDDSGATDENAQSETQQVTLVVTGTNDQPIVQPLTLNISNNDLENGISYYETHEENDVIGLDDTDNESMNILKGQLSVTDEDITDTHMFNVLDITEVTPTEDIKTVDINYKEGTVKVQVESSAINVDEIDLAGIKLLNNDGADKTVDFGLKGDFSALGEGETATVTFVYNAVDDSDVTNESKVSEPKTVTITVTGTNDQPVVDATVNANEYVVTQMHTIDAGENTIGYTYFEVLETTTITITTDGPTIDPNMYLLHNDSPITDSSILAYNDDGHTPAGAYNNSIITYTLQPGSYISAVSDFHLSEEELIAGFNDISDISTMTGDVTLTFKSDKQIIVEGDSELTNVIYETSDNDATDDDIDGVLRNDEPTNVIAGTLSVTDKDANDVHLFDVVDMDNGISVDFYNNDNDSDVDGQRVINVESSDIDVSNITINSISFLNNDAQDREIGFELDADFSALAVGETAVVTFSYNASNQNNDDVTPGESNTSETKTVTMTIVGTNDQPVVQAISETINETIDSDITPNFPGKIDDVLTTITGTLSVTDDDINDTHTFRVDGPVSLTVNGVEHTVPADLVNIYFVAAIPTVDAHWEYKVEGDFNYLGDTDQAVVQFNYVADDQRGETNEPSVSEPKAITITINGTNDRPVVENDEVEVSETTGTNRATNNDVTTTLGGTFVAHDQDLTDLETTFALKNASLNNKYVKEFMSEFEADEDYSGTTSAQEMTTGTGGQFVVVSDDINVDLIDLESVTLLSTPNVTVAGDVTTTQDFEIVGNFNALGADESATILVKYLANDHSSKWESNKSANGWIEITVNGTNDRPVVKNVSIGEGEPVVGEFTGDITHTGLTTIEGNGSIVGFDEDEASVDYWTVNHGGGDFNVKTIFSDVDPFIRVFKMVDGQYVQVKANDDSHGTLESEVNVNNLDAGEYIIAVSGFHFSKNEAKTGVNIDGDTGDYNIMFESEYGIAFVEGASTIENYIYETANDRDESNTFYGQVTLHKDLDVNDTHDFEIRTSENPLDPTVETFNIAAAGEPEVLVQVVSDSDGLDEIIIYSVTMDPNTGEYIIDGDFSSLAKDETATVKFQYVAIDDSGATNESDTSREKTVEVTITGTNDRPEIKNVNLEMDEAITGTNAIVDYQLQAHDDDTSNRDDITFKLINYDAIVDTASQGVFRIDGTDIQFELTSNEVDVRDFADQITNISISSDGKLNIEGDFNALDTAEFLTLKVMYKVDDNQGLSRTDIDEKSMSRTKVITLTIEGTNDAPILSNVNDGLAPNEIVFVENDDALVLDGQVTITDVDDTTIASATVEITSNYEAGSDVLGVSYLPAGVTATFDNGLLTITGEASHVEYEQILESVTFVNNSEDPSGLPRTITWSVNDGEDNSVDQNTVVDVLPVNDAPIARNNQASVKEEGVGSVEADDIEGNLITDPNLNNARVDSDVDNDVSELTVVKIKSINTQVNDATADAGEYQVTGEYGILTVNVDGTYSYDLRDDFAATKSLTEGQIVTDVFKYTISDNATDEAGDDAALRDSAKLTITITGTNDAPVLDAIASASLTDTEAMDIFTDINGTLSASDDDANSHLTFSVAGTDLDPREGVIEIEGDYGTLVLITGSGEYTYTPNADAINALSADATDTFTFVANDGMVDSLPQDLVINIAAADDTPVMIAEPDFSVIEDGDVFNGLLEASDVDSASLSFAVVGATPAGLTVNTNGTYNFDPSVEAYQSLRAGQTKQVSFQWQATDGNTSTEIDTVVVTITGTNDGASIINPENYVVQAEKEQNFLRLDTDGSVLEDHSQVLDMNKFTRVDSGLIALDVTGAFGPSKNGNNWNDAFKFTVGAGETANVDLIDLNQADTSMSLYKVDGSSIFPVLQADAEGIYIVRVESSTPTNSGSYKIRIAIDGSDVKEDVTTTVSGEMEVIDVDAGENVFQELTNVQSVDAYGEFSITPTGTWTYNLFNNDPRIQALVEGEELTDTFTVVSLDGTASELITIKIEGTNEDPVITHQGIESVSSIDLSAADFSAGFTFKTEVLLEVNSETFFRQMDNGSDSFLIEFGSKNFGYNGQFVQIYIPLAGGGVYKAESTEAIELNQWTDIEVTYDPTSGATLIIDGVEVPVNETGATAAEMKTVTDTNYALGSNNSEDYNGEFRNVNLTTLADDTTVYESDDTLVFNVNENSVEGTVVGMVSSTDVDGGAPSYSFVTPTTQFAIDSVTGEITVNGNINFEDGTPISLEVKVEDGNGGSDTEMVKITVNDISATVTETENPVVLFNDSTYVETGASSGQEGYTVKQTLLAQGYDVDLLTTDDEASFIAALETTNVFVMPDNESGTAYNTLSSASKDAIKDFVSNGGTLIMHADAGSKDTTFLNNLFGFSLVDQHTSGSTTATAEKAGSIYDTASNTLPNANGTYEITTSSLPADAVSYYENSTGTTSSLFDIPVGEGTITFIAYDWFNAAPVGSQDGGWLNILDITVKNSIGTTESLTFDQEGEIDMLSLLTQADDFNTPSAPTSLDEIDLTAGDHILSNMSIDTVLSMVDTDNTLQIKGDTGDLIKLDLGDDVADASTLVSGDTQWHKDSTASTASETVYVGKSSTDETITLLVKGVNVEDTTII